MGKLGKKARKFAKKNLQSVLRKQRKTKTFFKKRPSSQFSHVRVCVMCSMYISYEFFDKQKNKVISNYSNDEIYSRRVEVKQHLSENLLEKS